MECIKISNQRCNYYFPASGVSEHDLFMLWISLSKKGYYKIFDKTVVIDEILKEKVFDCYFDSLEAFRKAKGF